MRWGLLLVLFAGCHLVIDPDEHVNDSVDASRDVGADDTGPDTSTDDAGQDAGDAGDDDAGCDPPSPVPMAPACCYFDSDCPEPSMGPALVCHGGGTCGGAAGVCFPAVAGGGDPGDVCFVGSDCVSGTCNGGPNCGCTVACAEMMLPPGTCQ